jgi:protein involved in polysaccharide export with SLBB domain
VAVGPDGRISYLQATDIPATGLTVDQLREKLDQELAKYYRTPRTVLVPVTFKSKKYYVLGKVANRGVFSLERPLTIVEAVARAHGLETGLIDNNNLADIADLQRSFLMRNGQRLKVNFERLFQEGDLSQNVAIEPEDYLYFASMAMKEVYVLGEVRQPGPTPHTSNSTVTHAIANRGGFNDRAYKSRVVVIRGSLNNPRTYVVNVWETLEARSLDFKLEPRDIIYVHYRPFIKVEELLDLAASAFVQSAVTAWTGKHIGAVITKPIF